MDLRGAFSDQIAVVIEFQFHRPVGHIVLVLGGRVGRGRGLAVPLRRGRVISRAGIPQLIIGQPRDDDPNVRDPASVRIACQIT